MRSIHVLECCSRVSLNRNRQGGSVGEPTPTGDKDSFEGSSNARFMPRYFVVVQYWYVIIVVRITPCHGLIHNVLRNVRAIVQRMPVFPANARLSRIKRLQSTPFVVQVSARTSWGMGNTLNAVNRLANNRRRLYGTRPYPSLEEGGE